jgi:hypothetical protein
MNEIIEKKLEKMTLEEMKEGLRKNLMDIAKKYPPTPHPGNISVAMREMCLAFGIYNFQLMALGPEIMEQEQKWGVVKIEKFVKYYMEKCFDMHFQLYL